MDIDFFNEGQVYTHAMDITGQVMDAFGRISGDYNRLHTDAAFSRAKGFNDRVVYGNVLGMLISALVGMKLATENVMILSQSIDFMRPVYVHDSIEISAEVAHVSRAVATVDFKLSFKNQNGNKVARGKLQIKVF